MDMESVEFALRQSWEVHRQAFGPILEPAFSENQQVRLILINALNHISRREVNRGMELLKELHPHCIYDEDKAAWAFFVGLCFEMGGAGKQSLEWYEKAGKIGHRFYLPYLKLAKAYHSAGQLETARAYYETAISLIKLFEIRCAFRSLQGISGVCVAAFDILCRDRRPRRSFLRKSVF